MSVHDETWDKCPACKQTIKSWHGDFHNSRCCLHYPSWHEYDAAMGKLRKDGHIPPFFVDEEKTTQEQCGVGCWEDRAESFTKEWNPFPNTSRKGEPVRPLPAAPKESPVYSGASPELFLLDNNRKIWRSDQPRPFNRGGWNDDPPDATTLFQEYIPEMIAIEKDFLLEDLKAAIEAGLEYAQESLIRHDQELGRTTKKNKSWAETIEKDIAQMKQALERIKKYEKGE